MDVQPHGCLLHQHFQGQHVDHHFYIAHRIDMAVEVDVAVNDFVHGRLRRVDIADLARLVGRRRGIDDGVGMGIAHPRQVERRTALQVDHRPLRHRTAEFVARGVGQREITRREHPPVFVDPRGNRIVGILPGLAVEFHGHAREHPRMVVGIESVDPETFAVGVNARRIEDRRAQRRDRGPEREIHILRFDTVIIMRFFSHVIDI